ncbi:hypothetical protein ABZZ79_06290 [Streptomyces sp. NPDC006458]|uniref:hypothetical protein n=1 Tax=Streptomyces sp. NPDC006458 TaxID=3154302 RepID=UPI0033B5EF95
MPAATRASGGEDDPVPAPVPTVEADPAKVPQTKDAARRLIGQVIAGPELFGSEARRASPYESDPDTWSVLDESCVWQREPLPERVLATLTRHFVRAADKKATGEATRRGALLAVEIHNARSDAPFRLALRTADDRGEAGRAGAAAQGLLSGASPVTAVIGPMSEATLTAAEPLYTAAGAAMVLVSCDGGGLSPMVTPTLYVTRATQAMQTMPVLYYLTSVRSVSRVAVVRDRAGGAVAEGLTTDLMEAPPSEGTTTVHPVEADAGEDDVRAAVAAALATRPGGVVYAGTSPRRAAQVARRLAEARFTGAKVTVDQIMDPVFLRDAKEGAEGWVLCSARTTTTEAASGPAARFASAHRERWGAQPEPWAAEAYDAVGLVAQTLTGLAGEDPVGRGVLAGALFRQRYEGVAKTISFDPRTRLLDADDTSFLYEVRDGAFRFLGRCDCIARARRPTLA